MAHSPTDNSCDFRAFPGFGSQGLRRWEWVRRLKHELARAGADAVLDHLREFLDLVVGAAVFRHFLADLAIRVHDGGVVLAAELVADFGQGQFGQFAAQIHGDLARVGDLPGLSGADELVQGDLEVLRGGVLDGVGGDVDVAFVGKDVAQCDLCLLYTSPSPRD